MQEYRVDFDKILMDFIKNNEYVKLEIKVGNKIKQIL